nr:hypothetical protein [Clostridiales bacterium]
NSQITKRWNMISQYFAPRKITTEEGTFESFSMTLMLRQNGQKTRERYTFYHDGGKWYLYNVETGRLR